MNLTLEFFKNLWTFRHQIFNTKPEIFHRFNATVDLFDTVLSKEMEVTVKRNRIWIGKKELTINLGDPPSLDYFGPASDEMTSDKPFLGLRNMVKAFNFTDYDLVKNIGCLLGGYDFFRNHKMHPEYKLLSIATHTADEYCSLSNEGAFQNSAQLTDNNYFFNVMRIIQHFKKVDDYPETIPFVLLPPNDSYFSVTNDDKKYSRTFLEQQKVLRNRFPSKFFWMWANKNQVIHPLSLMSFRNFLDTELMKDIISEENFVNIEFEKFTKKWRIISEDIFQKITSMKFVREEKDHCEWFDDFSKIISIVCTEETHLNRIESLLKRGNKSVILYGPPGVGKTHEAKRVAHKIISKKEIIREKDFDKEYLFVNNMESISSNHGYYTIVQFHPNYTYQNFIGGIHTTIYEGNLKYEIKDGIFKQFCALAKENKQNNYVFIIDGINRADLFTVFGDLLYCIEHRNVKISIPHFGDFLIPDNLYLIGTMSYIDGSNSNFDMALRHKFHFYRLLPDIQFLPSKRIFFNCKNLHEYRNLCINLNKRIVKDLELSENCQIGQFCFEKITDFIDTSKEYEISTIELERIWEHDIYPIIEDYLGSRNVEKKIMQTIREMRDEFLKI